jgi:hypothetical protein
VRRRRVGRTWLRCAAGPVVAGGHEELSGGVHADAEQGKQLRCDRRDQGGQVRVQVVNLGLQCLPAAGQCTERGLRGGGRVVQGTGAVGGADADALFTRAHRSLSSAVPGRDPGQAALKHRPEPNLPMIRPGGDSPVAVGRGRWRRTLKRNVGKEVARWPVLEPDRLRSEHQERLHHRLGQLAMAGVLNHKQVFAVGAPPRTDVDAVVLQFLMSFRHDPVEGGDLLIGQAVRLFCHSPDCGPGAAAMRHHAAVAASEED